MDDELAKLLSQMGQNQGQGSGKGGGGGGGNANSDSIQGHAERLWKFLDNLAENDPEEYQNFLKKQAEAAGMDGKTPFAPKEHPVLVVICSKQQANKQVALLVFDDKEEAAKRGSEEDAIPSGKAFGALDMGFKLKRKVHEERTVEGLPHSSTGGYVVVDAMAKTEVLEHLLQDQREQKAKDLDTFVNMLMHWAQSSSVLAAQLDPGKKKVLLLRKRLPESMRNREAAQGTSASDLPENILGEIAQMGIDSSKQNINTGAKKSSNFKGPMQQTTTKNNNKKKPLITEISTSRSAPTPCILHHEVLIHHSEKGEMKVKASLDKNVNIKDLEIHLKEGVLTFTSADYSDYEVRVPLPEGKTGKGPAASNYSAKYSKSSHRLTVKLL